ncbi:MAG: hypothetical protein ACOYOE_09225 [Chlorobium sp.]
MLRAKLMELNPGLPDTAYDDALRQVVATTAVAVWWTVTATRAGHRAVRISASC